MATPHMLLHCNAGAAYGMGHLVRCLALAEEAISRGWRVTLGGDIDDVSRGLAQSLAPDVALVGVAPRDLPAWIDAVLAEDAVDVVHLDTYWDVPDLSGRGILVSSIQDAAFGLRDADLAIDPNLGAEARFLRPDLSRHQLAGADAAIVRAQVRRHRNAERRLHSPRRVLVVLGGTDPERLTSRVVAGLDLVRTPLEITVVVGSDQFASLSAQTTASRHGITVVPFLDDLPGVASEHDLVVSAAGTSVWDFACMGVPMALVCAVDNQRAGYRTVIEEGLAYPLGEPPHARLIDRAGELGELLEDDEALAGDGVRLRATIDGLGTWRIVSAWEQLRHSSMTGPATAPPALTVRAAEITDGGVLFAWRNDPATRSNSRASGELRWEDHLDWLDRVLADPDRRLLVVELEGLPVATVRWDRRSPTDWEVSITVSPAERGRGLAGAVLRVAEEALRVDGPVRLVAVIHRDNTSSRRVFERAGYLPQLPPDARGFESRAKWRFSDG